VVKSARTAPGPPACSDAGIILGFSAKAIGCLLWVCGAVTPWLVYVIPEKLDDGFLLSAIVD
jgi:hypothetical protein